MATLSEIVDALEDAKHELWAAKIHFAGLGLDWDETQDSRSAWFDGTWKVLSLTQAHWYLFVSDLQHIEFWQRVSLTMTPEILEFMKPEADILYKFSVLHTTYTQLEEVLRRITAAFDPNFMSTSRSIGVIHGHLIKELGLPQYANLFWLSRLIRNSIHNNGYFQPDQGGDQDVRWAGTTYLFRVGQSMPFIVWPFLADHIKDLCDAMIKIVTHDNIRALPTITRPAYQPSYPILDLPDG